MPVTGGTKDWECLTSDNKAASSGPLFSADGTQLVYRAQKQPGYEADRWELMLVDDRPERQLQRQAAEHHGGLRRQRG